MATEPSETHHFRAKNGLYYDSYEKMRDANVRLNQEKLKAMGLLKENRSPMTTTTTSSHAKRKKSLTAATHADASSVEPLRRSERTPRQVTSFTPPPEPTTTRPKKKPKPLPERQLKQRKKDEWDSPILNALRQNLKAKAKGDVHCYADFQAYWEPQLSRQNYRTIVRQVDKLMSGQGITYLHWPAEVCFHGGQTIDMSMDLDALYQKARQYEELYGPDLGKGASGKIKTCGRSVTCFGYFDTDECCLFVLCFYCHPSSRCTPQDGWYASP